jgi:hypothetical protein
MRRILNTLAAAAAVVALALPSLPAAAQGLTLPPSGANQKSSVIQQVGLVEVRVDYSSPDVTGPQGQDRRGHIWGELVPYGLNNLGFGTASESPWRAGANENTVFTVSHDVRIQGQPLAAGSYGLHMIPAPSPQPWTIVFSHESTAWGSFFYDPAQDALRVEATPEAAPFREWLAYDFVDRRGGRATLALHWEELRVPFEITVPNVNDLYVAEIRRELQSSPGFSWTSWMQAAQFAVQNQVNLEEALTWAESAISAPFVGNENFNTLGTKSQVLAALGRDDEADAVMQQAIDHPTANVTQIHGYGRLLQTQGRTADAVRVFKLNGERHGDSWPVHVGLARAYSAEGDYAKALVHAKKAREQAPDPVNQGNLDQAIEILERGADFNATN